MDEPGKTAHFDADRPPMRNGNGKESGDLGNAIISITPAYPASGVLEQKRLIAAFRVLLFPRKLKELWSMDFMKPFFPSHSKRDTFFFLTHNYYLAKHLSLAQRIDSAISHYRFEQFNYRESYHRAVYHSVRGLELWRKEVDGIQFSITLRATEDNRYEGDLSILCFVNDARVCRLSFTYVKGKMFGFGPEPTMFVTRNQTDCNAELRLFRDAFKQNSPPYFCIAAACGIAMANGMKFMLMIQHDAQIAYSEQFSKGFQNSYSMLWEALGAVKTEHHPAYVMPIPLALRPLSELSHKRHKARALGRRRNWLEITRSARSTVLGERMSSTPLPLEVPEPTPR